MPNFYIDGAAFSNSTSVFTDAALTNCAPNGFYSDGIISRELVDCVLLPAQVCPNCAVTCDVSISTLVGPKFFITDVNEGTVSTGAIIVKFNPNNVPDGIAVLYDGGTYNKLSSPIDGLHKSTNPLALTFVGNTVYDCGISGNTYPLAEYVFTNGTYVPSGAIIPVIVNAGDVSLSAGVNPGFCVIVIPKPNPTPSTMQIVTASPCTDLLGSLLEISCPTILTGYPSSIGQGSFALACPLSLTQTYYNVPVTGTAGNPNYFDWVFSDPNGEFVLPNGYYAILGGWMQVQDGIVILKGLCP
jgi:hypothetical protein